MQAFTRPLLLAAVCGTLGAALGSCVDDNYDLSDIDTTARIDVKDLVIPLNIDAVTLGDLLKPDPDDRLQIVDGEYCVIQQGQFTTADVVIPSISMAAPQIPSVTTTISAIEMPTGSARYESYETNYPVKTEPVSFRYAGTGNSSVVAINSIYTNLTLTATLSMSGLEVITGDIFLRDLTFQFPAGLTFSDTAGGVYDAGTGLMSFSELEYHNGSDLTLTLSVSAIDYVRMGGTYDQQTGAAITGEIYIADGGLFFDTDGIDHWDIPARVTLRTDYTMSAIDITRFDGRIRHMIDDVNINDIDLSDLPDAITGEGTSIRLANPQIDLSIENPLADSHVTTSTGLTFTSYPRYESGTVVITSLPEPLTMSAFHSDFCLAPNQSGTDGQVYKPFPTLSQIFDCGTSVPARIGVTLDDPQVPEQNVNDFELGKNIGSVSGQYTFRAPLAFEAGTKVTYTDVLDGWGEDMESLTVEELVLDMTVDSDLPLGVTLSAWPVDASGAQIKGVVIEGTTIAPNARNQHVVIRNTGTITNMDGVRISAVITGDGNTEAVKPGMSLKLTNVRPRVTGYYQKEL